MSGQTSCIASILNSAYPLHALEQWGSYKEQFPYHTTKHLHSGTFVLNCVVSCLCSGVEALATVVFFKKKNIPGVPFTPKRGQVMSTCFAVCYGNHHCLMKKIVVMLDVIGH